MSDQRAAQRARRTSRPPQRTWVPGPRDVEISRWNQFLSDEGRLKRSPRLCNVLGNFRETVGRESGLPWVVPVLGSGCLAGPSEEQLDQLRRLPALLAAALPHEDLRGGAQPRRIVWELASALLMDRIPETAALDFDGFDRDGDSSTDPKTLVIARSLLAAALLDRARHEVLALRPRALRPGAVLPLEAPGAGGGDVRLEQIRPTLLRPAEECLQQIESVAPGLEGSVSASALRLIAHALDASAAGELRSGDVDAAIEAAWLLLIQSVGIYPGWKEFMAAAAIEGWDESDVAQGPPDVRRLRMSSVTDALATLEGVSSLVSATEHSWERRDTPRASFYKSVADLLIAQSGPEHSAIATAFVTSMDVELEMALVQEGRPFTMLVPYHFVYGAGGATDQRAMLVWLAATIDPADLDLTNGFDLSAAPVRWRRAPQVLAKKLDPIVVVRLVGSPLLPVATLDDAAHDPSKGRRFRPAKTLKADLASHAGRVGGLTSDSNERARDFSKHFPPRGLVPAFVLDEYSGMHQMVSASQGLLPSNLLRFEVPGELLRYWLAVGVQIDDALVRLLLASYVDADGSPTTVDDASDAPAELSVHSVDRHGVMVNRRVSIAESDLLSWQGLAAVQAPFSAVTEHVEHYARHLDVEQKRASDALREKAPVDKGQTFVGGAQCRGV